jgi:hypothetical protein
MAAAFCEVQPFGLRKPALILGFSPSPAMGAKFPAIRLFQAWVASRTAVPSADYGLMRRHNIDCLLSITAL